MRLQKEKVESFHIAHKNFMENLSRSLDVLEHDIDEATEVDAVATGRWSKAIETSLDELSNYIYSISEPRWVSKKDSKDLHRMRDRVHDLYAKYRGINTGYTH